jgi:hypothetical protein
LRSKGWNLFKFIKIERGKIHSKAEFFQEKSPLQKSLVGEFCEKFRPVKKNKNQNNQ